MADSNTACWELGQPKEAEYKYPSQEWGSVHSE